MDNLQNNMSQPIKMSESDLAEIKMLQGKFQELVYKLGNMQVEKIELEKINNDFNEREKKAKTEWTTLQKMEQDFLDKLVKIYGEGSINMADGTFVKKQ